MMDDLVKVLQPLIRQFMPFAQERMGFDKPPRLFLRHDTANSQNPFGKTAHYDPGAQTVALYVTGRHPKDILRSLAHELVHHSQCCRGEFENAAPTTPGYAQQDDHMREMEREAYEKGNMCFRDWEDSIKNTIYYEHLHKGENRMSTKDWKNGEITQLLSEAWGFKFNTELLSEATGGTYEADATGVADSEEGEDDKMKQRIKSLEEDGATAGDQGGTDYAHLKRSDRREREQYDSTHPGHGGRGGDQGGTDYGGEDDQEKRHLQKEDSGARETWDQWKNEHADDDHIREIEHHLRALKDDRDYERHEAEYDDDKYEDEHMHEAKIRKLVRARLKSIMENKNGRSKRVAKVSKRRK